MDWHAAARAVWMLRSEDTGTGEARPERGAKTPARNAPRLTCAKSNYGPRPEALWLAPAGAPGGGWRQASATEAAMAAERGGDARYV